MKEFFKLIKDDIYFTVEHYKSKDAFDDGDDYLSSMSFKDYTKAKKFYEDCLKTYKRGYMMLWWMTDDGDHWMHILKENRCSGKGVK